MRDGNVVALALSSFFGEVSGEGWFPKANVLCGIEERITEIARTAERHRNRPAGS